eukprot:15175295-Alexandrium_andersonii.AAC.1
MACCLVRLAAWWAWRHTSGQARGFTHLPWQRLGAVMLTIAGEKDHPPAWARGVSHPVEAG